MTREEIKKEVIEIADRLTYRAKNDILEEHSFNQDLGFDSLDEVEFIFDAEKKFGIDIPDEAVENVKTVKDAIDVLEKLLK
jgi:acyl carrier protein